MMERVIVAIVSMSLLLGAQSAMAAEEIPDYVVEYVLADDIEVRRYPLMLLAEVDVYGDRQEAATKAFRVLAGFIFGDNAPARKIDMTAPVTASAAQSDAAADEPAGDGEGEKIAMTAPVTLSAESKNGAPENLGGVAGERLWTVAFMMPSEYSLETLPAPSDPSIRIRLTDPYRAVAIRFSGRYTNENMEKHKGRLDAAIAETGLSTLGAPIVAYYNGPFTPFFMRRNEIQYRLAN